MSLATRQSFAAYRRFMFRFVEKRVEGCNNSKHPVNNFTNEFMHLLPFHDNYRAIKYQSGINFPQ